MEERFIFRLAAQTDPAGRRNDHVQQQANEDALYIKTSLTEDHAAPFQSDREIELSEYGSLMVVADGLSEMCHGETASMLAIQCLKRSFSSENLNETLLSDVKLREEFMEQAFSRADRIIKDASAQDPQYDGMGCSLLMVWLCKGVASVTWCGNSRAYLFREPFGLQQITHDHTFVQQLIDDGDITQKEAFRHPASNIVTNTLGGREDAHPQSVTTPVYKNDILLMCSDGLNGVLFDATMEEIIRQNRSEMDACLKALWKAAKCAGWNDNVTTILCEIRQDTCEVIEFTPEV